MTFYLSIVVLSLAFGLSSLLVSKYSPISIHDNPNERSLHKRPTPRTGGIAVLVAIFVGWGGLYYLGHRPDSLVWIAGSALLVAVISFIDDLVNLSPISRFVVHALCAALLIFGGIVLPDGVLCIVLTWLSIVWMINLYNFMDGMDGFAAGMTVFGFGFLGAAGWIGGVTDYALYSWIVALASIGFLLVNFPPARIFLGDIGSVPLGLLAAAFSIWGIADNIFPLWYPLLVFSPFVIDATVTLLRRLYKKEKIWQAHRSHYYQRLVLSGWSHKRTVLFEYLLMGACGASALIALEYQWINISLLFVAWLTLYVSIHFFVTVRERQFT